MSTQESVASSPSAVSTIRGNERSERFDVSAALSVSIRTASGDVTVTNGDDATCTVRAVTRGSHAHERLAQAEILYDAATNSLRVVTRPKSPLRARLFDFHDLDVHITAPLGTHLDVHSASGDLDLKGTFGDVRAASASGDVKVGVVSGELNVNVASGAVEAKEVYGNVNVKSASGDVTLGALHAETKIHAVSGDVRLTAVAALNARVHSVSGDLLLKVQRGFVVNVNAKTVSGSMHSDINLDGSSSHDSADSAGIISLDASTVSGDVKIARS